MPLLDHFRPPLHPYHHWSSFHSNWATRIADWLSDRLPPGFTAEEHTHAGGSLEIATMERSTSPQTNGPTAVATTTYAPPAPSSSMPATFPESFEVKVFSLAEGLTLVGAIELVSPANKDRPAERRAFAARTASYLYQGVSVIVIDVVTTWSANLHNATMRLMEAEAVNLLPDTWELYGVAYRPVRTDQESRIDQWTSRCELGQALPTLPLWLVGGVVLPVDFESTYQEACRRRRLA